MAGRQSTIVSQFRNARFPDTISADWNRIVMAAASDDDFGFRTSYA
jgi:hypothetical protein